jgi:hypothetical protein
MEKEREHLEEKTEMAGNKMDRKDTGMWRGFIWLRLGINGGLLCTR